MAVQNPKSRSKTTSRSERIPRRSTLIIAAALLSVIGMAVGLAIYQIRIAPFQATVLKVNDTTISMGYLLNRILLSGQEPLSVLEGISVEQIIAQAAPLPPYNITVTEEDIDSALKETARGESASIAENEYQEWYRQRWNESRLSEVEYRELVRTNLVARQLTDHLVARIPTVAEQVHVYMILRGSRAAAAQVKVLIDGGQDFLELARDPQVNAALHQSGGELGWFPRRALATEMAVAAFDETEIGKPSEPIALANGRFAIILVSERVPARVIDDGVRQALGRNAFDEWLDLERDNHRIEFGDPDVGWTSETDAWVKLQLQKLGAVGEP